jgi:hypothetical protein
MLAETAVFPEYSLKVQLCLKLRKGFADWHGGLRPF